MDNDFKVSSVQVLLSDSWIGFVAELTLISTVEDDHIELMNTQVGL